MSKSSDDGQDYSAIKKFVLKHRNNTLDLLALGFIFPDKVQDLEMQEQSPQQILESLLQGYITILKNENVKTFRLSGGIDSRLILYFMEVSGCTPDRITTFFEPSLGAEDDRDAKIVSASLKKMGLSHLHDLRPNLEGSYFADVPMHTYIGGGTFGGELLGGMSKDASPYQVMLKEGEWKRHKSLFCPQHHAVLSEKIDYWFDSSHYGRFVNLMTNSPRSLMYESVQFGWSQPRQVAHYVKTPFLNQSFLRLIASANTTELEPYRLYRRVMDITGNFLAELPITHNHYQCFLYPVASNSWGRDAKQMMWSKPSPPIENKYRLLKKVLIDEGFLQNSSSQVETKYLKIGLNNLLRWIEAERLH